MSWEWFTVGAAISVTCVLLGQPRIGPPMPPVPPLPTAPASTLMTNGGKVFEVRVIERAAPKVDMPAALPVSEGAPHHYYGIVEFKPTKAGVETENEVFYFGLYPNEESFQKAHGVGNPKFNRKFKAVIRVTSELPNEPVCVWQRREGFNP